MVHSAPAPAETMSRCHVAVGLRRGNPPFPWLVRLGSVVVLEQSRWIDLLVQRGASVHNLRIAAGLGRTDVMESH